MSNATSIIKICENCNHSYCMECSTAGEWARFCSNDCQDEFESESAKKEEK